MIRNLLTKIISASIKKFSAGIISIVFSFFFFITSVMAAEYTVKSIYSGGYVSRTLQIHNGQVVWANLDGNYFDHIYLYDGTQTKKLTNNRYSDSWPRIHNGQVAWTGYDGNDYEIYLYDGSLVKQLTNNNDDDSMMGFRAFHNGQIVWTHWDGNFAQIWLYDGSKVIPLTFGSGYVNRSPQIHNGQVVWRRYNFPGSPESEYQELLLYDGTRRITLAKIKGPGPFYTDYQIHNGQVVWRDWDGNDREIYLYDGSLVKQLTNNNDDDYNVMIHNGQIVWMHWDGNDDEIYLYDGSLVKQLTNNNDEDFDPQIHNGQIVWKNWDGNDYEILLATPVTAGQPVLEILDGSDFTAGPEVSSEPTELASGGTSVEGAVTDGVTRLLLRLSVDKFGPVTFTLQGTGNPKEDGVLRSINNKLQKDNTVTVNTVEVNGKQYAFAIYQAPENFVRKSVDNDYNGKPDDETASERTISIKVECNNTPPIEKQIKLVRLPLILVHGLWSNKEMWDKPKITEDFKGALEKEIPGINIFTIDYSKRNASHFETNKDVPYSCKGTNIQTIRERYKKSYKIAMVQADILGHSMGGILTRIWAGAGDYVYNRDENFWMGDINKLISLDSPHYGSFLADAAINCHEGPHSLDAAAMFLLFEKSGHSITKGAVEDLMTTSEPIKQMNRVTITPPSHTIAGQYVDVYPGYDAEDRPIIYGIPDSYFGIHNMLISEGYGDTIMRLVTLHQTDLVVSIQSQHGGLDISSSNIFGHHHTDATTSDVLKQAVLLLNSDTKNELFNLGFTKAEQ